ncbi:hypothetical protein RJ640_011293 [Escallonia rubra]|uniref:EXPERA domain-containing protein n=1 Tax=Escallonia rubra TaxID=112253 RepID=A0AA88SEG0_9ASTE|nr:hypothetical protein RJ640_011293 [Escallonia rubra]
MGSLIKFVDAIVFIFFLAFSLMAPLLDAQICLPRDLFPSFLIGLKNWYARVSDDYLLVEQPHFFVGVTLVELLFLWPLSVAGMYGAAARKSWFSTICLVHGVSTFTCLVSLLAELLGSRKASDRMLMTYYPFLGFALLAILRGLLPHPAFGDSKATGKRSAFMWKKRA